MSELSEHAMRGAQFYNTYWDHVPTASTTDDPAAGPRNVAVAAIVDLLCFAQLNGADTDVVLEAAKKEFVDMKMRVALQTGDEPEE